MIDDLRYTATDTTPLWTAGNCSRCGVETSKPGVMCTSCGCMRRLDASDTAWMTDGLCNQVDPALFFPEQGASPEPARRVCRKCPVMTECLTYALKNRPEGVWGATTTTERDRILKGRAA